MPKNNDECPVNPSTGDHRYFVFKTVEVFEPVVVEARVGLSPNTTYYRKMEYAILGCNCGSVIKSEVEHQ